MYRTRYLIWCIGLGIVLFIMFGLKGCSKVWNDITYEPSTINVYWEGSDNLLKKQIEDVQYVTYTSSMKTADGIIKEHSNETIDGYKKYKNKIYSPIVMFVKGDVFEKNEGFTIVDSDTVYKDLHTILTAMEDEKTFSDIGINKKIADGKVRLYIPNERSKDYKLIKELFFITLNDFKMPTDEEKIGLEERIEKLLNKCVKVDDISQKMIDIENGKCKDEEKYTIFLGSENIISNDSYEFDNSDGWVVVYPNITISKKYDLYLKEDIRLSEYFSKDFSSETGYRIKDGNYENAFNYVTKNLETY